MKAVILAGGEGSRLRPLSLQRPKPMVPLFDHPVLESILTLLHTYGITEICMTLHYRPDSIRDYFGNGSTFGVSLTYFLESTPLGTAGSVKACSEFLGDEDFLVISGDAVCNFNLSACIAFHQKKQADATLILHHHDQPLEYGLVVTKEDGTITRFVEKPAWGQVCTNTINTGIYICSSEILRQIPENEPYDFGKDVFPTLLQKQRPIYGYIADGYWCDIGDCSAYLQCMCDSLHEKTGISPNAPMIAPGIWSDTPLPDDIDITPPCYIGKQVTFGTHVQLGPNVCLGAHSKIGAQSKIKNSLLEQTLVGSDVSLQGAITYRGTRIEDGAVLREGTVVGDACQIGTNAILMEGCRIWPNQSVPADARQNGTLSSGRPKGSISFGDGSVLRGIQNIEITPEFCLALGASLGEGNGPVSVGWAGGTEAENLADVLLCGIRSAGGAAIRHDGGCESAAVWLAQTGNYPRSVFVRINDNTVFLRCLSENGLPFSRAQERKLEGALLRGEQHYISKAGPLQTISGIGSRYAKAAATEAFSTVSSFRPFPVAAEGDPSCTQLLSEALSYLGCPIQSPQAGIPIFHLSHGGLRLSAVDESGRFLSPWHMVTLLSQIAFRQGHRAIAVPPEASCGVEQAAEAFQAQVLRLGRDGAAAEQLYIRQHFLRDALFGTLHLCAYLGACRTSLSAVAAQLPPIYTQLREIPLRGNRGAIMEHLSKSNGVMQQKGTESGLHFHLRSGHVYLAPLTRRAAIRIIGEGQSTEIASELCDLFTEKIKKADQIPPSC
ncbi:MAG: NTP transferase domain-containing protein [Oscillospiraceae bacterium]|nr:NTP transferase domain-containing protein [Oscillospiraceae bacterium]